MEKEKDVERDRSGLRPFPSVASAKEKAKALMKKVDAYDLLPTIREYVREATGKQYLKVVFVEIKPWQNREEVHNAYYDQLNNAGFTCQKIQDFVCTEVVRVGLRIFNPMFGDSAVPLEKIQRNENSAPLTLRDAYMEFRTMRAAYISEAYVKLRNDVYDFLDNPKKLEFFIPCFAYVFQPLAAVSIVEELHRNGVNVNYTDIKEDIRTEDNARQKSISSILIKLFD